MRSASRYTPALLLLMFPSAPSALAEHLSPAAESLYYRALSACLDTNARGYGCINASGRVYNVIVQANPEITPELPRQVGHFHVDYLEPQALLERCLEKGGDIPFIIIQPVERRGEQLVIGCTTHTASAEEGELKMGLRGGCTVKFRYDDLAERHFIDAVEIWEV